MAKEKASAGQRRLDAWSSPGTGPIGGLVRCRSSRQAYKTVTDIRFHSREFDACLEALQASAGGLTSTEAADRLRTNGPNRLPEPPRRSALLRFLAHFNNVLIYVLLASSVITFLLQHLADTAVILAVVIVNAVIGFIQEGRAERAMDSIRDMLAPKAAVLRDGERRTVAGDDLVTGDIVLLEAGDRVPADLRLFRCHGLQIEEAIVTGESVPVQKAPEPVAEDAAALGDRSCMAFSGTLVTSGQGRGLVVATGAHSEIGTDQRAAARCRGAGNAAGPADERLREMADDV